MSTSTHQGQSRGRRKSPRLGARTGLAILLVSAGATAGSADAGAGAEPPVPTGDPPNIIVILTDDQRADQVSEMGALHTEIASLGATVSRAFVANPLCCPARASILTGTYSHTNLVWTNGGGGQPELGGWPAFHELGHESRTIAVALDDAGYHTALVGKYLNRGKQAPPAPGWDRWVVFGEDNPGYYHYDLRVDPDGTTGPQALSIEHHGSAQNDYSTDVLAEHALSFVESAPPDQPLFLLFSPFAPHAPATPAPRHAHSMDDLPVDLGPAFNERNVDDKPAYIRATSRLSASERAGQISTFRRGMATLEAVDETIADLVELLEEQGRLENTLLLFTSDNGIQLGVHRWKTKMVPYEESIHVPMVLRWDGRIPASTTTPAIVSHVDIAPTLVDAAGTQMPGAVDGTSLLPVLTGQEQSVRNATLFEHVHFHGPATPDPPSFCGVHTASDRVFVRYATGEEEFYDLRTDPCQLHDRSELDRPAVAAARAKAEALCPFGSIPGFVP